MVSSTLPGVGVQFPYEKAARRDRIWGAFDAPSGCCPSARTRWLSRTLPRPRSNKRAPSPGLRPPSPPRTGEGVNSSLADLWTSSVPS